MRNLPRRGSNGPSQRACPNGASAGVCGPTGQVRQAGEGSTCSGKRGGLTGVFRPSGRGESAGNWKAGTLPTELLPRVGAAVRGWGRRPESTSGVGVRGLEPPTSASQTPRATRLRHTPPYAHAGEYSHRSEGVSTRSRRARLDDVGSARPGLDLADWRPVRKSARRTPTRQGRRGQPSSGDRSARRRS